MAMLAILAACHKYFACGNKVLFCSAALLNYVHHSCIILAPASTQMSSLSLNCLLFFFWRSISLRISKE